MRRSFLFFLAILTGCGVTVVNVDGGPPTDGGGPAGELELLSEPSLLLTFEETAEIEVRYTEGGRPVGGEQLRVVLEGRANDAQVGELTLITAGDGRARVTLTAPTGTSVFRLRVSAERASPVHVDVSVGDAGFGGLVVGAIYSGTRVEYARRIIQVFADTTCDLPEGSTPSRQVTVEDMAQPEVMFRTLPAGLLYTVVGTVEGSAGTPLATACVDGVEIVVDAETRVDFSFIDAPLAPAGSYEVEVALRADAFAELEIAAVDAGRAYVATSMTTGGYLDALEAELRDGGHTAEADGLAMERGIVEPSLEARLMGSGADVSEAVRLFFARLLELLGTVRVRGPFDLVPEGDALGATFEPDALAVGSEVPDGTPPLVIDPMMAGLTLSSSVTLAPAVGDAVRVEPINVVLLVGALMSGAMWSASADPTSAPGADLRSAAGCAAFGLWIAESPTLSPVCDTACADRACMSAVAGALSAAETALTAGDTPDTLSLSGEVALFDDDGDLRVDRMEGALLGAWSGAAAVVPVDAAAELSGTRL